MKFKHVLLSLGLALTMGVGVATGIGAKSNAKVAKAATTSVTLAGSFNGWNTTANPLTLNDGYYTVDMEMSSGTTFKFVVNGSTWVGWGAGISYPSGCFGEAASDGNIQCNVTGEYLFKAINGIDGYDEKTYGLVIESVVPPVLVDTTLQVTFSAAVPEYVDIFVPGAFNSWADDNTTSKMTRVNSTTFTYTLDDVAVGTYEYKVVACYAGAASMDWNHEIDASNQSVTIQDSDDGKTVALGSARSYNFAANMPQETVADGAVVQLTFASAVPTTVDIIFVGGLTNWGTTVERMAAGKMTANGSRTVFTWDIPADTYTGNYGYKIVAMSRYTSATAVAYDYLVYGVLNSDETLTIDTSTLIYALNALSTDLSELGAVGFAEGFIAAMATPCADEDANNKSAVSAIWTTWKDNFEALTSGAKTRFGASNDTEVVQARTLYLHCVARYSLAAWSGAPAAFNNSLVTIENQSNATIIIIMVSAIALIAAGGFFLLRKKREN